MKRTILLIALILASLAPLSPAQDRPAIPAYENAALRYWEAWWEIGPEAMPGFLAQTVSNIHGEPAAPRTVSPEGIELLMHAASISRCDFGLRLETALQEDAPNGSGDHIWLMHRSYNLLLRDAEDRLDSGDTEAAAHRILAALRMAEHAGQHRWLITADGSASAAVRAVDFIEASADRFTDTDRQIIGQSLDRFDASDPFWFARSLRHELTVGATAVRKGVVEDDLPPEALEQLGERAWDLLHATDAEFERIWASLLDDYPQTMQNAHKRTFIEIHEHDAAARQRLDWLREWASQ